MYTSLHKLNKEKIMETFLGSLEKFKNNITNTTSSFMFLKETSNKKLSLFILRPRDHRTFLGYSVDYSRSKKKPKTMMSN
jgi:hypothetical protein